LGVSDERGVNISVFSLILLVIVTYSNATMHSAYRAACDAQGQLLLLLLNVMRRYFQLYVVLLRPGGIAQ